MLPTDNLKLYISKAILPPIPVIDELLSFYDDKGEEVRPALNSVVPADWRQLYTIKRLEPMLLTEKTMALHARFPDLPLNEPNYDPDAGVDLCIPSSTEFEASPITTSGGPAATILEEIVFQTACRALHLVFPSSKEWCFQEIKDVAEEKLKVRIFGLTRPITTSKDKDTCSMLVFVFTKWAFDKCHNRQFADMKTIPNDSDMKSTRKGTEVTIAERIWMKVWDVCRARGVHHWAVTTYDEWFFGGFSEGWTTGSVSPVRYRETLIPTTTLQELITWMASSLKYCRQVILDRVPEPAPKYCPQVEGIRWVRSDELAHDDDWSCPSEYSRIAYLDPRGRNPLDPKSPGSDVGDFAGMLRDAEDDAFEGLPIDDRKSESSMETVAVAYEEKLKPSTIQMTKYLELKVERTFKWVMEPRPFEGQVHRFPEELVSEETQLDREVKDSERRRYFCYRPNPSLYANVPHLPIDRLAGIEGEERKSRIEHWARTDPSKFGDPSRMDLNTENSGFNREAPASELHAFENTPEAFDLSLRQVQAFDNKPIIKPANMDAGSCVPSMHSLWSSSGEALQQSFGDILDHIDSGADSVRDILAS